MFESKMLLVVVRTSKAAKYQQIGAWVALRVFLMHLKRPPEGYLILGFRMLIAVVLISPHGTCSNSTGKLSPVSTSGIQ
jgi:hypothetical protein